MTVPLVDDSVKSQVPQSGRLASMWRVEPNPEQGGTAQRQALNS